MAWYKRGSAGVFKQNSRRRRVWRRYQLLPALSQWEGAGPGPLHLNFPGCSGKAIGGHAGLPPTDEAFVDAESSKWLKLSFLSVVLLKQQQQPPKNARMSERGGWLGRQGSNGQVNSNTRAFGGTPAHEKNHFGLSFCIMARFSLIFLLGNLKSNQNRKVHLKVLL